MHIKLVVVVVAVGLLSLASALSYSCTNAKAFPTDSSYRCSGYVNYLIPDWDDATIAAQDALTADVTLPCLFYRQREFTCARYFPYCGEIGEAVPEPASDAKPMCKTSCLAGYTWNAGSDTCSRRVSESAIESECSHSDFSTDPDTCRLVVIPEPSSSKDWKWIMFGIFIGLGGLIALYLLYSYCKEKRVSPELTDDDVNRAFEHERRAMAKGTWTGPMPPVNSTMTSEELDHAHAAQEKMRRAKEEVEERERARQEEETKRAAMRRNNTTNSDDLELDTLTGSRRPAEEL